ncbi:MAG TPA: prepilin-type N-terminal cleavage/methylation domain-containing protein [Solirubrobacteraceae bacterium]|nr:prepilin-type N-terminal cleavage/methylation domain-containing protein [Solirubrobacteraceae bacterium]
MEPISPLPRPHADEQGFTLIELLVTMLTATVVAGALFAVLNLSTTQTAALSDKVQADQLGRIAMTRIVNALHSACIAPAFTPIQENSTGSKLIFITAYSEKALIPEAELHEITWSETLHTLTDSHIKSTGGAWPDFTFPETRKSTPLAQNITQNESGGKKLPIFRYYSYATETTTGEAIPTTTLNSEPLPGTKLSVGEAEEAASVLVSFNAAPTNGKTTFNRSVNLSAQTTFAYSVPNSETPIHDAPCQ